MKIFFVSSLLQYRMHPSGPLRMEFGSGVRIHPEVQCHHISPIICQNFIMENYCIKCSRQRFVVMGKYHSHQGYILYWSETAKLTWFNLLSRHVDVSLPLQSIGESLWSKWYLDASSRRWEDVPPLRGKVAPHCKFLWDTAFYCVVRYTWSFCIYILGQLLG